METRPTLEQAVFANAEQAARDKALRRFNWLFVYAPVALVSFGILALLVWLAWATLPDVAVRRQGAVSGVADIVLILWLCPTVLVCALFPALGFFLLVKRRQSGSVARQRVQRLLWRAENLVMTARGRLIAWETTASRPIIVAHGAWAYARGWWAAVRRQIRALIQRH